MFRLVKALAADVPRAMCKAWAAARERAWTWLVTWHPGQPGH